MNIKIIARKYFKINWLHFILNKLIGNKLLKKNKNNWKKNKNNK